MIEVNNLTFAFKGRGPTFEKHQFLFCRRGKYCAFWARTVWETTLLKTITGLYQPLSGTCHIGGIDGRKARLAHVPQARHIQFSYSVLDFCFIWTSVMRGGILPSPGSKDLEQSAQMLADLGVSYLESKKH